MAKTILAFGETLWDLLPTGRTLGGAPFNFAYRLCCMGDRGTIVSRLGRDALGQEAYERIIELGMDPTFLQWDDHYPTGTVRVSFDAAGRPDYFIVPDVAYDHVQAPPELLATAAKADCVCFGSLSQRAPAARETLRRVLDASKECLKVFDVNLRRDCHSREIVAASLERADILRCNEDETLATAELLGLSARDVPGFCREVISRFSLSHCLVTLGERGACAMSADGEGAYVPGFAVKVVDTLGAGDAFTAGFVHRLLRGQPLAACLEMGNAMGAMVAAQKGATEPVSEAQLEQFLASRHERILDDKFRKLGSV